MRKIAIVGAGIGGLTLYHALKLRGIRAELYESAPALLDVGAALSVAPNGMQVLARLGLADAVFEQGWILERAELYDVGAGMLQTVDFTRYKQRFGYGLVGIHRAALQKVLMTGVAPEDLHLGKTCVQLIPGAEESTLLFADGSTAVASVIIAADGIRSVVRQHAFPASRLRYSGATLFHGVVSYDVPELAKHVLRVNLASDATVSFAGIGGGRVYMLMTVDSEPGQQRAPKEMLAELQHYAERFPDPVPGLAAAITTENLLQTDLYGVKPLTTWHTGNVVLLGDAAHATTPNLGQGAAQAIEDAYVLADSLAREPVAQNAFKLFQKTRMPKAHEIARTSWLLNRTARLRNPVKRGARNLLYKVIPASMAQKNMDRMYELSF